jgi:hypothetical protein
MLGKVAFSNYLLPVFLILLELMGGGGEPETSFI